jgi:DNA-binding beta-propeller fold protein YncE
MIVVDKAVAGTVPPTYRTLAVKNGNLATTVITTSTPVGGSPTIAYVSPDQKFLFGTEFLDGARASEAPSGQIDAFSIGAAGVLTAAPGSPYALPPDTSGISPQPQAVALNLVEHPTQPILYVGFPTRAQLGVYTIDQATGALSFVTTAASSGKGIGWFKINKAGTRLYAVNSASATISVFDLTNPKAPVELSSIPLKNAVAGPPFTDASGVTQTDTSLPFELTFSADQTHLWVVSQRVTTNATDPLGNYIHTLDVASDGSLTEPDAPLDLHAIGVSSTTRPQGIASLTE